MSINEELFAVKKEITKFAEAIISSEEYQEFDKAEEVLSKDEEAQKVLEAFEDARKKAGFDMGAAKKASELQLEIKSNEVLSNFFTTQANLVDLCRVMVAIINKNTRIDFAAASATKSGGCGGGCC